MRVPSSIFAVASAVAAASRSRLTCGWSPSKARARNTGPCGAARRDRDWYRHVHRHVVGDGKRRLEETGAGARQLVAHRLGRQDLSDDGARRWTPRVAHRIPAIRRHAVVGDVRAGRPDGTRALQERSRVGDSVDRRHARLRLVRQPWPCRVRFQRQACVAQGPRRRRQLPRRGGLAAALQESRHPLSGF